MPKKSSKKRPAQQTPRKTSLPLLFFYSSPSSSYSCPNLSARFFSILYFISYLCCSLIHHIRIPLPFSLIFISPAVLPRTAHPVSLHFVYYFFLTDELQANCGPSSHPVLSRKPAWKLPVSRAFPYTSWETLPVPS